MSRWWLLVGSLLLLIATGCGGGDEEETRDPGCDVWIEFLAESEGDAPDSEAAAVAREVAEEANTREVREMATALAARLEDGVDLGNTMTGLGSACGLLPEE